MFVEKVVFPSAESVDIHGVCCHVFLPGLRHPGHLRTSVQKEWVEASAPVASVRKRGVANAVYRSLWVSLERLCMIYTMCILFVFVLKTMKMFGEAICMRIQELVQLSKHVFESVTRFFSFRF